MAVSPQTPGYPMRDNKMVFKCHMCGAGVYKNDLPGRAGMCRQCSQDKRFREILNGESFVHTDRRKELKQAISALKDMGLPGAKATLTEDERVEALESMLDELLFLDEEYRSSGWETMSDTELAKYHVENPVVAEKWPRPLLRDRGITIKECSVCDKTHLHHDHDYMCIPCRVM